MKEMLIRTVRVLLLLIISVLAIVLLPLTLVVVYRINKGWLKYFEAVEAAEEVLKHQIKNIKTKYNCNIIIAARPFKDESPAHAGSSTRANVADVSFIYSVESSLYSERPKRTFRIQTFSYKAKGLYSVTDMVDTMAHELKHIIQMCELNVPYLKTDGNSYDEYYHNPYEVEARRYGKQQSLSLKKEIASAIKIKKIERKERKRL